MHALPPSTIAKCVAFFDLWRAYGSFRRLSIALNIRGRYCITSPHRVLSVHDLLRPPPLQTLARPRTMRDDRK